MLSGGKHYFSIEDERMVDHSNSRVLVQLSRGGLLESFHCGDIAVVNAVGTRLAWHGDAERKAFMRSAAKPFQAIPIVTSGAAASFHLGAEELAIACGSHAGSDHHRDVAARILQRLGFSEGELLCGAHSPFDTPTAHELIRRRERPTALRNNCSGKHAGMLAVAKQLWGGASSPTGERYLDSSGAVQRAIVETVSQFCGLPVDELGIGIDGCSAPNFALSLHAAARGAARLFEPVGLEAEVAAGAATVTAAMIAHPFLVAGTDRFDTVLMEVGAGRWISKIGAEGYQLIAIRPGVVDSHAVGITFKIDDGDPQGRAAQRVAVEVLRQLGALTTSDREALARFEEVVLRNWQKMVVGTVQTAFSLSKSSGLS